jgi:formylmethanofuran dehydrogenase subunit B
MFVADSNRKLYLLGEFASHNDIVPDNVTRLHCDHAALPRLVAALRALLNEQRLDPHRLAESDLQFLREIASAMRAATYGVIVWAAPDFDFPHGELTIQTAAELIKDLNKTVRFAGLPLGGSDGDFSSNGVQTWQTGFPLRTRYAKQALDYDPHRYGTTELLAAGEVDALLWISSFNAARVPPASALPSIVLASPGMQLPQQPDVFIPVGTPGIHQSGHFIRADKVVVMHLAKLLESELPSVATVLDRIHTQLAN